MQSMTLKKTFFALCASIACASAQASDAPQCYSLQIKNMKEVARELGIPEVLCVDSIRLSGKSVKIRGKGLPSEVSAEVRGTAQLSRVSATLLSSSIDEGICSRTASASLTVTFVADEKGFPVSDIRFSGVISDTSDNCHLNGESEFIEYIRN